MERLRIGPLDRRQVTARGNWLVLSAAQAAAFNAEEEFLAFFPPSGNFGAYTYEENPDTAILFQDVALEPFYTHQLSLSLGYNSADPIVAPPSLDNVTLTSTPPNNAITRGKVVLNKKKGTGKLTINVPGPGTLTAVSKGKPKRIETVHLTATAAGALKVPLNPTGAGRKALKNKGNLKAQLEVTFTPTGGLPNIQLYKVTLKKTLPKKR